MTMVKKSLSIVAALAAGGLLLAEASSWRGLSRQGTDTPAAGGDRTAWAQGGLFGAALALANQPPAADAGLDQTVAVNDQVVLDGSGSSDLDGDELSFNWTLVAIPADSTAMLSDSAAVKPRFQADMAGDYVAQLTVTDNAGSSTTDTVVISTVNVAPVADAGPDQSVAQGDTVRLDASASSDFDGDRLSFAWTVVEAPPTSAAAGLMLSGLQPIFVADMAGDYLVELVVSEDLGGGQLGPSSDPDMVRISTTNSAPVGASGPDQKIVAGQTVILRLEALSDVDGDLLDERDWTFVSRPPGSQAAFAPNKNRRFVADVAGTYVLQRMVDDGLLEGAPETLIVTTNDNLRPVADAGPDQTVAPESRVDLRGAGSSDVDAEPDPANPEDSRLTYRWALTTLPPGSAAALSDPAAVNPSFTADLPGTYVAQLIVDDGTEASRADTVVISTEGSRPMADAGPDQKQPKKSDIQLDGSGSLDVDGDPPTYGLAYDWALVKRPSASSATLNNPDTVDPTFFTDTGRRFVAQLIVNDGQRDSAPDTVVIGPGNMRPVAEAGADQLVLPGTLVTLNGGASVDPGVEPPVLTYRWALIAAPEGSGATLSDPAAVSPSYTADLAGVYVAQLIVTDDDAAPLESNPDTVVVVANTQPVANAGPDQTAFRGDAVELDGTASSDPDENTLDYDWTLVEQPAGSTTDLADAESATPSFVPDLVGIYVVELVVDDGFEASDPDTVVITVVNRVPVADAGPDQVVTVNDTVQLVGSASSDPDGDALTFAWSLTTVPTGSSAALSDPAAVAPTFVADVAGSYVAELVVSDGQGGSAADIVTITAESVVAGNRPPVLDPIGDLSVDLGSTLSFTLTASDPDGDTLGFTASPLPLLEGAGLNSATGEFAFTPNEGQVGDISITFIVSDGVAMDAEPIVITVVGAPVGGETALAGRLLDTNDFVNGIETPIVGATVSVLGGGAPAFSDNDGNFLLSGIPAGTQIFDIDAATANNAPDGSAYAGFREAIGLIADVTNNVDRPFFLPRIEADSLTTVDPSEFTVVENTRLGVTMQIPPGRAKNPDGTLFTGQISISEVPLALAPAALPEELQPGLLITIQPVGVTFDPPVPITFPNVDGIELGSRTNLWSLDPQTGRFDVVGIGQVVQDEGTGEINISTIAGGIRAADWHFPLPPETDADEPEDGNSDNNDPDDCEECDTGSITHANSGNLRVEHELVSYRSLGEERFLRLIYNSTSADPQPLVPTNTTVLARSAVPSTVSTRISVAGVDQGTEVFSSTAGFDEGNDETIRQVVQIDAQTLPTGIYPYRLSATSNFSRSRVSQISSGQILVKNEIASPFGAGWTLEGLHRLSMQGDTAVIVEGRGSIKRFAPIGNVNFGPATPFGDPISTIPRDVGDVNNDGKPDVLLYQEFSGKVFMYLGDGDGGILGVREQQVGTASNGVPGASDFVAVRVGDFDGDRIADLAVGKTDRLVFHRGLGSGYFEPGSTFSSSGAIWLDVTDMNGDDVDDLVVGNTSVLVFNGSPGAGPVFDQLLFHSGTVSGIVGRDLNDDGLTDIVTASSNNNINVYLNEDGGAFSVSSTPAGSIGTAAVNQRRIDVGDVTGDGFQDIIVGNGAAQTVSLFPGDGSGSYPARTTLDPGHVVISADVADVNGDGVEDIVASGADTVLNVSATSVLLSDRAGSFGPPLRITSLPDFGLSFPAQLDGDALADFAMANPGPNVDAAFVIVLSIVQQPEAFLRPQGDFSTLTMNADATLTRRLKDGMRIEFDAAGRQTAEVDRKGNTRSYTYDATGNLTSITDPVGLVTTLAYVGGRISTIIDPAGRVTGFEHDADGNLTKITDPDGSVRSFAYDERRRMASQTSKRGFVTSYDYGFHGRNIGSVRADGSTRALSPNAVVGLIDSGQGFGTPTNPAPFVRPGERVSFFTNGRGNIASIRTGRLGGGTEFVDALGRTKTIDRDGDNKPVRIVAPNGRVDEFTYDERGNLLSLREAVGTPLERVATFEYEPDFNRVTRTVDVAGEATVLEYDANGNLLKTTNPLGAVRSFTYDSRGLVLTETDENLNTAALAYDARGNLSTYTDAEGNTIQLTRDSAGNVTALVEGVSSTQERVWNLTYDALNRILSITDANDTTIAFNYDAAGNLIRSESATGEVLIQSFDSQDRLVQVDNPATGQADFGYDQDGNLTQVTDARGAITTFEYDGVSQLVRITDPLNGHQERSYNQIGNLTELVDPRGNSTNYDYDLFGRLTEKRNQIGDVTELYYDSRDNVVQIIDAINQTLDFTYDKLSRVLRIESPDNTIDMSYDPAGNVLTASDDDSSLTFDYDRNNRLITVDTNLAGIQPVTTLSYQFDAVDNLVSVSDSEGGLTSLVYDAASRLTDVTAPAAGEVSFAYDPSDRITGMSYPNAIQSLLSYDMAGRLSTLSHSRGLLEIAGFAYSYNEVGNIDQIDEGARVKSFGYDLLDQVTAGGVDGLAESYDYDTLGNRITSHLSALHITDAANRLIEDNDFTYSYNANGNLVRKSSKADGALTIYEYNAQNQLVRIDFPGGGFAEYRYDAIGRRIEKNVDGALTRYVYNGEDILLEFDGTDNLVARYSHGALRDQPLAMSRGGQSFYFHADHQGSIRKVTNATGEVVNSYDYDSFGRFENRTEGVANPFTYTGREFDPESGLYFYRSRYYDPDTGRFLTEDPLDIAAGDLNLYRYVFNNSVNLKDPDGEIAPLLRGLRTAWSVGSAVGRFLGRQIDKLAKRLRDRKKKDRERRRKEEGGRSGDSGQCEQGSSESSQDGSAQEPSEAQLEKFRKQLQEQGPRSLRKSQRKIERRLNEHLDKLQQIKQEGGFTSSVEREIRNFRRELEAIRRLLGGG